MGVTCKLIFTLASLVQASIALTWTNQAAVRDGTTIPVCAGQNVDLSWAYTVPSSEHVVDIEWHFTADGHATDEVLATQVNGHFFADPSATQHMQHIANAGIRLISVTTAQSGVYSVNVNIQGRSQTYSQSVHVVVTAATVTTDGSLHAYLDKPMLDGGSQEYHLMLGCGTFNSVWDSRVNVVWTTPGGQTLNSTMHENGEFWLAIPNPLASGQYTCKIDNSSPAKSCIASNSPLLTGATVHVDGTEGRLMLLESRESHQAEQIHALQSENSFLSSQVQTLQNEKTSMTAQIHTLQAKESSTEAQMKLLEDTLMEIRLADGFNQYEGRVEVRILGGILGGTWGTVCDHGFDANDAEAICHHFGYPYDEPPGVTQQTWSWINGHWGQGSGPILLTNVDCSGSEKSLLYCSMDGQNTSQCSLADNAGVICGMAMRLVNGSTSHEGRLEVRIGPTAWGTVCDDGWGPEEAKVLCRNLGFPSTNAKSWSGAHFGQGTGDIMMDDVDCAGTEEYLLRCSFKEKHFGRHNCAHSEDVGITCA